jgi:hypothetical protein
VALSQKDREKIIEEETLRYETRANLHKKACAERPVRWPWILGGALLVYALWAYIFCGPGACSFHGDSCRGKFGMHKGKSCHGMMYQDPNPDIAPGQPIKPGKK